MNDQTVPDSAKERKGVIAAALIGAVATVAAALIAAWAGKITFGPSEKYRFPVAVFDEAVSAGLPDATIHWNIPHLTDERTDASGQHTYRLSKEILGKDGTLTVSKPGYVSKSQQVEIQDRTTYYEVRLARVPAPVAVAPAVDQPAQMIKVYSSGPKISGSRKDFSDWYKLCSDSVPGYHIESATFTLSGDRRCNAWSECAVDSQAPTQVCYKFRLQGHDEQSGSGQAYSEGQLSVTWLKG